jgi:hypothetical protein
VTSPQDAAKAQFRREALPHDIDPYQKEAGSVSMQEFEKKRPYPFLLYARSKLWDPSLLMARKSPGAPGEETQLVSYELVQGGMTFLSAIRKRQSDPKDPKILLGRAVENDVVVPVASVSSVHLTFLAPQSGPNPVWTVTDLGSRNGTWLNEAKLGGNAPHPIRDGEYLRLGGNLIAWFLYPGRLWHLLKNPAEMKKLTDL